MSRFLTFVVEETLAGKSGAIKESVIAVEVFEKSGQYDPHADSTVRTEAGKLRAKLSRYYETQGQEDPIVISIPKGTYVPAFENRSPNGKGYYSKRPADSAWNSGYKRRWAWILSVSGCIAAAAGLWFLTERARRHPSSFTPVPLTSYPGEELQPTFSPDGTRVAFTWNGQTRDNFDIYVKEVGADRPLRLTTDPAKEFGPAWSPDGRSIAFGRLLNPLKSGIFAISSLGGRERKLAESRAPSVGWPQPFVAWTPDNK